MRQKRKAPVASAFTDDVNATHAYHVSRVYASTVDDFQAVKTLEQSLYTSWRHDLANIYGTLSSILLHARAELNEVVRSGLSEISHNQNNNNNSITNQVKHNSQPKTKTGNGHGVASSVAEQHCDPARHPSFVRAHRKRGRSPEESQAKGSLSASVSHPAGEPCDSVQAYARSAALFVLSLRSCWPRPSVSPCVFAEIGEYAPHDVVSLAAAFDTISLLLSSAGGGGGGDALGNETSERTQGTKSGGRTKTNRPQWPRGDPKGWWTRVKMSESASFIGGLSKEQRHGEASSLTQRGGRRRSVHGVEASLPSSTSSTHRPEVNVPLPVGSSFVSEMPAPPAVEIRTAFPCEKFPDASVLWARCVVTLQPFAKDTIKELAQATRELLLTLVDLVKKWMHDKLYLINTDISSRESVAGPRESREVGQTTPLSSRVTTRSRARFENTQRQLVAFLFSAERTVRRLHLLAGRGLVPLKSVLSFADKALLGGNRLLSEDSAQYECPKSPPLPNCRQEGCATNVVHRLVCEALNVRLEKVPTTGIDEHEQVHVEGRVATSEDDDGGELELPMISIYQRVVFESLHFAPLVPPPTTQNINVQGNTSYSFQSILNVTPPTSPSVAAGAGDGGGNKDERDGQANSITMPCVEEVLTSCHLRPFVGPHVPQCYVGAFVGFPLLVRELLHESASSKRGGDSARRNSAAGHHDPDGKASSSAPISLNGPVIILGMGGNVALNLLAEQLLAPTAAGEAFLKANPLFSLHVVELEPSVMRTCAANGLLPGYESVGVDATYTCGGEVFHVKRSIHLPSWASDHVRYGALKDAFAKYNRNVQSRVYYHVGVDAMACDLTVLVGDAMRTRRVGSAASVDDASEGPHKQDSSAVAELILLDCFDPLMKQMDDPMKVLTLFRSALSPTGMLCVNSHMNPADLNRGEENRSKAKGGKNRKNSKSNGATVSSPLSPFVHAFIDPIPVQDIGTQHAGKEGRLFSSLGVDGSVSALQFNALSQFFVAMTKPTAGDGRHGTILTTQTSSHGNTNRFCEIVPMDGRESRTAARVQHQQHTEREGEAVARLPPSFSSLVTILAHLLSFELTRRFFLGNLSFCWDLLLDSASNLSRSKKASGHGHGEEADERDILITSNTVGVSNSKEAKGIAASVLRGWGVTRQTSIRVPLLPRSCGLSQLSQSREQSKRGSRPVKDTLLSSSESTRNVAKNGGRADVDSGKHEAHSSCCHYDTPIWCA